MDYRGAVQSALGNFGYALRKKSTLEEIERYRYLEDQRQLEEYYFARNLKRLFALLDVRCVLDVGAHRGEYGQFLRNHVGYTGTLLSFEPVNEFADALREKADQDPNWFVYDYALGATDSESEINVYRGESLSSFLNLAPKDEVLQDIFSKQTEVLYKQAVKIYALDSVYSELNARHGLDNAYLKVDTQGFDLQVFEGAEASLPNIAALQSEVSVLSIYDDQPRLSDVVELLGAKSFHPYGMYPVLRDPYLRAAEFDCVMINKGRLSTPIQEGDDFY